MTSEQEILTQTQRVADLLMQVAKDITAANRKELSVKLKISMATLSKYLNGNVADVETGIAILQYCRGIITKRENQIAA